MKTEIRTYLTKLTEDPEVAGILAEEAVQVRGRFPQTLRHRCYTKAAQLAVNHLCRLTWQPIYGSGDATVDLKLVTAVLRKHDIPLNDRGNFVKLIGGTIDESAFGVKIHFRRNYRAAVDELMTLVARLR
jgi:hypothetical protein